MKKIIFIFFLFFNSFLLFAADNNEAAKWKKRNSAAYQLLQKWKPGIPDVKTGEAILGVSSVAKKGDISLTIEISTNAPLTFYQFYSDVTNISEGEFYEMSAWVKTERLHGGVGAFMGVGAIDTNAPYDRLFSADSERVNGNSEWTKITSAIITPKNIKKLKMVLLVNGRGKAYFNDVRLTKIKKFPALKADEIISVNVTDKITTKQFIGFGYEDDAFFFNDENQKTNGAQYLTQADLKLRDDRIKELAPSVIATLFWWDAISPSHDINKITYDTRKMRDFIKMLEVHQKAGRKVFMGDVHWGWSKNNFPYNEKNVEKGAREYAKLIKYLIKEKGLTCLKFICISGEVDMVFEGLGGSFATYTNACVILRKELDKAGLENVKIVGDKSGGFVWLEKITPILDDQFDIFTIHEYPEPTQVSVVDYRMKRTTDIVKKYSKPIGKDKDGFVYKPVFLYEIGANKASDGGAASSLSPTFDYGLLCANTAILGLNNGIVGGSVWCLHSMYYPGYNKMKYGIWEFKDKDWKIRPVFYGYGLFSKFARAGMLPLKVKIDPLSYDLTAGALKSKSGKYVFYAVNLSDKVAKVKLTGLPSGKYQVYEYTKKRIPKQGNRLYGKISAMLRGNISINYGKIISVKPKSILMLKNMN